MRRARPTWAREAKFPNPWAAPPPPSAFPKWAFDPRPFFRFELIHTSRKANSRARVGRIHTPHGTIDTPGFVAVATNGALKFTDHREAAAGGCQLMFCNSYHLLLQPGPDTIAAMGGLHKFINREGPIITDSGGFQIFSLAYRSVADELKMKGGAKEPRAGHAPTLVDLREEGVTFKSYRDGTRVTLTPESTVHAQKAYGADIIIPLDELPPYHIDREALHKSVLLTHRWEARSLLTHLEDVRQQAMYGVVHGGVDRALRQLSVQYLRSLPFDGLAVGGALGKTKDELIDLLAFLMPQMPTDKPNHLLGIADVDSIRRAVPHGVDTFDSCFPTRVARHGTVLTRQGPFAIRKTEHKRCDRPLDDECQCPTCRHHTRAYVHHLFKANEPMAAVLITAHNIQFMCDTMADLRARILQDEI